MVYWIIVTRLYLPYGKGEQHWIGHAPHRATEVDVVSVTDFIGGFPSVRAPVDAVRSVNRVNRVQKSIYTYSLILIIMVI